jgi:hypothetical protein
MQDLTYAAVDGLQVILTPHAWAHIQQRHPEVTFADIDCALTRAFRVCDHRQSPAQQVYEGPAGSTRHGPRVFPLVIVERVSPQAGVVVTARVSRRPYKGGQRWP